MTKVVKYASDVVHPIEMKHGELAEVVEWYNNWLPVGTIVIRITNSLYVVGEDECEIPENIVLNKTVTMRVKILKPGTVIQL